MSDEPVKKTRIPNPQILAVQVTQELADTRYDDTHFVKRMMRLLQSRSAEPGCDCDSAEAVEVIARALAAVQPAHVNETPKREHVPDDVLTLTAERDRLAVAVDAVMADRARITAERERLRGACEGAVNWLDALLHQVQATSCEPDDPKAFDEVLMGADLWLHNARAALKGETNE